jgi:hypothetical protein
VLGPVLERYRAARGGKRRSYSHGSRRRATSARARR